VMVWSWDHLSSKAVMRDVPDALFVWNEIQKQEAIRLHRFPPARVSSQCAQCYDAGSDGVPTRSRSEFCRRARVADERPSCCGPVRRCCRESARTDGGHAWAAHLRKSTDPRIRDLPILLRPHPSRTVDRWAAFDWRSIGNNRHVRPTADRRGGTPPTTSSRCITAAPWLASRPARSWRPRSSADGDVVLVRGSFVRSMKSRCISGI
jgi:hypothetical protein